MSSSADEGFKVAVLGAAGGIGQSLALLMKVALSTPRKFNNPHGTCASCFEFVVVACYRECFGLLSDAHPQQ